MYEIGNWQAAIFKELNMADRTKIEWADASWSPVRARMNGHTGHYCEMVSPGCANCYSSANHQKGGEPEEWPIDLRVREFPAMPQLFTV